MLKDIDNTSGLELLQQTITSEKLEDLLVKYRDYQQEHSKIKGFGLSIIAVLFISKWLFLSPSSKGIFLTISTALLVAVIYKAYVLYKSWASVCKPINTIANKEDVKPKVLRTSFNQLAIGRFGGGGI